MTKHNEFPRPYPGRLKLARLIRGNSVVEVADFIGITRQAISKYELGHTPPSGQVFSKMVEFYKFPPGFFYQPMPDIMQTPIYFRSLKSATKSARDMLIGMTTLLFEIFTFYDHYISFPEVNIPDFIDMHNTGFYDFEEIEEVAKEVRKCWGLGLGAISNVTMLLEQNGIVITRAEAGSLKTDACSGWINGRPYIFLGSNKQSAVRSRFDCAHELAHILLHTWVDEEQLRDPKFFKQMEKEADHFAGSFLMPDETFSKEVMSTSLEHFKMLKRRWLTSIQSMIFRCDQLELLTEYQVLYLRKQLSQYRKKEPLDDELLPEEPVMLNRATKLLLDNRIMIPDDILNALHLYQEDVETMCLLEPGTLDNNIIDEKIKLKPHLKIV